MFIDLIQFQIPFKFIFLPLLVQQSSSAIIFNGNAHVPVADFYLKRCVMETNANKFSGLRLSSWNEKLVGDVLWRRHDGNNLFIFILTTVLLFQQCFSSTPSWAPQKKNAYHVSRKKWKENLITISSKALSSK